jgi:hypothetical protein
MTFRGPRTQITATSDIAMSATDRGAATQGVS